jgi:hypothetical protein
MGKVLDKKKSQNRLVVTEEKPDDISTQSGGSPQKLI